MNEITQIIFDCDGVLIDSELLIAEVESELRTELGMPISVEDYLKKYVGLSTRSREYTDDLKVFPPNYAEIVGQRVRESMQQKLKAMPGAREFLSRLTMDTAIASSSTPEELEFSLKIAGLHEYFTGRIFSVMMVEHSKPMPDIYLYVANQTGHDPKSCLVIEDSVVGATAAVAAGMRTFGFYGASHLNNESATELLDVGVEAVFSRFTELPDLLLDSGIRFE